MFYWYSVIVEVEYTRRIQMYNAHSKLFSVLVNMLTNTQSLVSTFWRDDFFLIFIFIFLGSSLSTD